jgi:hypothetical protein
MSAKKIQAISMIAALALIFGGVAIILNSPSSSKNSQKEEDLKTLARAQAQLEKALSPAGAPPAGSSPESIAIPSTYRIFTMCSMEDPECFSYLRRLAKMAAARYCSGWNNYHFSDLQLWGWFMQTVNLDQKLFQVTPDIAMIRALSIAVPCIK